MAQLKSTIVTGNLQVTEKALLGGIRTNIFEAPTASNGTIYGTGSAGNVLVSNGTSIYWGTTVPSADAAALTTTVNAVAYFTDTAGTFGTKASANGALYATAANGALQWGTLPVAQGGTGKTTGNAAANYFMNSLDTGSSTPVDADYYISQYVSGGTTTTTYHRRPMSALWSYINGKISSVLGISNSSNGVPTAPTAVAGTNTTQIATTAFVANAIASVAGPMRFRGSLGTGGTASSLSTASTTNQGDTYKVITQGTYAGVVAKVGDVLISSGNSTTGWVLIPSGDEPSGTVTSITLKAGTGISLDVDNTAITTSGTRTITNTGVRSITTGSADGTISVNTNGTTANVSVKGLGTAAYTASGDYATSSHVHGNITNAGTITATGVALASGDSLVFVDSNDSSKIKKTSITFDGSTATKALTQKGTFETFLTQHQSLSAYAPLASPALTGTPTAPTAAAGTNTTQIATTAFVKTAVSGVSVPVATTTTPKMDGTAAIGSETKWAKGDHVHPTDTSRAPLASPTFTGTPKAPTATDGNNSTQIATTAYVDNHDVPSMKVVPMQSKTYTGVIGTANSWAGATFFFGSIRPTSFYETWSIKLRLKAVSSGVNNSKLLSDIVISGSYNNLTAYSCFNSVINTSYRAVYYAEVYRLKEAGFNAGYGHALGIRLYSAWNATTAANARTVDIEIYECVNCSFEFFDSMTPYASIPGTGSTNYDGYSELNVADNGLQETGDANSTFAYQIRRYNGTYLAKEKIVRYMICVQCSDTELLPMNSTDNSTNTTKVMTTSSFNPFGQIFYYGTSTNVNAGAAFGTSNLYTQTYNIDGRYSFNWGTTLTSMKSIYLVCVPQSNGMVKLHTTPWSQNLPTTEDGYVYIYLGEATSTYQFLLEEVHPVYYFKDGAIREWTNPEVTKENIQTAVNNAAGTIVTVNIPVSAWNNNVATVTCNGVSATSNIVVTSDPSTYAIAAEAGVYCSAQGTNSLTFTAMTMIPTGNITMNVWIGTYIVDNITYAPLASPALTGTPTAPTATAGTNSTQIATTAFVTSAINGLSSIYATKASPTLTGIPTAPTAAAGTATTQIATTEFVSNAVPKMVKITANNVSSLPQTVSNTNITSNMEVIRFYLSNPEVQTGNLTVTTSSGSLTIAGSLNGSTSIILYLSEVK